MHIILVIYKNYIEHNIIAETVLQREREVTLCVLAHWENTTKFMSV